MVNSIVKEIWLLCFSKNIEILKPEWIASRHNTQADWASRVVDIEDWTISDETWERITATFGTPEIDCFASVLNTRCKTFHSRWYQPNAAATNTFTTHWGRNYMFWAPPVRLIPTVLQKIKEENAHGILFHPQWMAQPWYSTLKNMALTTLPLGTAEKAIQPGPSGSKHLWRNKYWKFAATRV